MCHIGVSKIIFQRTPLLTNKYEMFWTTEKLKHVKTLNGMIFNAFLRKCASTMLTNSEHALDV